MVQQPWVEFTICHCLSKCHTREKDRAWGIQMSGEEKNKQQQQKHNQTSSHLSLSFHGIINFTSPHSTQSNLRENGHNVK